MAGVCGGSDQHVKYCHSVSIEEVEMLESTPTCALLRFELEDPSLTINYNLRSPSMRRDKCQITNHLRCFDLYAEGIRASMLFWLQLSVSRPGWA